MADSGWQRRFDEPIPLPDGWTLVKLPGGPACETFFQRYI